jgi:hypothetical protein
MSHQLITYPSWDEVAPDFAGDGGLRDIYIFGTTTADWERVLGALKTRHRGLRFTAGEVAAELPDRAAEIFPMWDRGAAPLLSFEEGGVLVTCHFFTSEEIEFSIDPADITGQQRLDAISGFLYELASVVGKVALLTPENLASSPILRADPGSGRVEFVPEPPAA